jgi:hypothetical protein
MPRSYSNWDVVRYILYIRGGVNPGWYRVHHRKRGGYIEVFIRYTHLVYDGEHDTNPNIHPL